MYQYEEIKSLHLEISSRCNAACPGCPRNFNGYPHNDGYLEHDMTLAEAQKIFPKDFIRQLDIILINGNLGDAVMNPDTVEIVRYFRESNPDVSIEISTNGGARSREFWQELARLRADVYFCLDGLEDTLHLYRQNVLYSTVIKNAQDFIKAGGRAMWKMIKFHHNAHQIDRARELSVEMGFAKFLIIKNDRHPAPVYDKHGNMTHVIDGGPKIPLKDSLPGHLNDTTPAPAYFKEFKIKSKVDCWAKNNLSIYVTSTGEVYPCCFVGFSPRTMGRAWKHFQIINQQTRDILSPNSALERPIKECMEWFNLVVRSWSLPEYQQGRLLICDQVCGK